MKSGSGRYTESLPVDVLSVFDCSKENNAGKCVAEQKEEHAHDDEEALVHADYHSQQQHLQSHLHSSHTDTHSEALLQLQNFSFGKRHRSESVLA